MYRAAGQRAYTSGLRQVARGDCKAGAASLARVIGYFHYVPGLPVEKARASIAECPIISAADAAAHRGDLRGALSGFRDFVAQHPRSVLEPYARRRWGEVGSQWGAKLISLGSFKTAIETFEELSSAFPGTPLAAEARRDAADAYLDLAAAKEGNTASAFHWQEAVDAYRTVVEQYADTDAASAAGASIERLYRKAVDGLKPGHGCDPLDILRALTRDELHVQDGVPLLALAQYRCVVWEVGHGYSILAVDEITDFLTTYPDDPHVPDARRLLKKAREEASAG